MLDRDAVKEMVVGRWESVSCASKQFVGEPTGAVLAALVSKYCIKCGGHKVYVLSRPSAHLVGPMANGDGGSHRVTPRGIQLVRRPANNNKNEGRVFFGRHLD